MSSASARCIVFQLLWTSHHLRLARHSSQLTVDRRRSMRSGLSYLRPIFRTSRKAVWVLRHSSSYQPTWHCHPGLRLLQAERHHQRRKGGRTTLRVQRGEAAGWMTTSRKASRRVRKEDHAPKRSGSGVPPPPKAGGPPSGPPKSGSATPVPVEAATGRRRSSSGDSLELMRLYLCMKSLRPC